MVGGEDGTVAVRLDEAQREALKQMHNGCILCGGVGSGKTRVGLAYYHCIIGKGRIKPCFEPMTEPVDLYVITTAATRDKFGWEKEMVNFCLYDCMSEKAGVNSDAKPLYETKVTVDSWNNIKKYIKVENAFFIFDEQRVTGSGPWANSFQKITKKNRWILLSATPGDTWSDYAQVFIANGFYRNITEFREMHVIYNYKTGKDRYLQKPKYFNTKRLSRLRDYVLVDMDVTRETERHNIDIFCGWDRGKYRAIMRTRWNPWTEEPIENVSALCQCLRKVVNSDASRLVNLVTVLEEHPKAIVFYNFNYERDMILDICQASGYEVAEWNGRLHQEIPNGEHWVYLVQYFSNEGWQCISTDTMIFFSQNYSYKVMEQASGRIDRRNTPYKDLYYYHFKSKAPIDLAITRALSEKKTFNESRYMKKIYGDWAGKKEEAVSEK